MTPAQRVAILVGVSAAPLAPFAFDPAKKAAVISLTLSDTVATNVPGGIGSALSLSLMTTAQVFRATLNIFSGSGCFVGIGDAGTNLNSYLGVDSNSAGVRNTGVVLAGGGNLGNAGFTYTTGDVIRMQINATQMRFSKNGGAYSAWFTHGVAAPFFSAITLLDAGDKFTGAWE